MAPPAQPSDPEAWLHPEPHDRAVLQLWFYQSLNLVLRILKSVRDLFGALRWGHFKIPVGAWAENSAGETDARGMSAWAGHLPKVRNDDAWKPNGSVWLLPASHVRNLGAIPGFSLPPPSPADLPTSGPPQPFNPSSLLLPLQGQGQTPPQVEMHVF